MEENLENKPSYYAVIPAEVRYDKELSPSAKLLYGEITALCNKKGFCWATNKYFAELYDADSRTVQRWIVQLEERGYIEVNYQYREDGKSIESRCISMPIIEQKCRIPTAKMSYPHDKNVAKRGDKNVVYNNTSINNTFNNRDDENKNKKRFTPPTVDEVKNYCKDRNNNIDAEHFVNYYDSIGWMVGKSKMKDWKAAVRTWERNDKSKKSKVDELPYL